MSFFFWWNILCCMRTCYLVHRGPTTADNCAGPWYYGPISWQDLAVMFASHSTELNWLAVFMQVTRENVLCHIQLWCFSSWIDVFVVWRFVPLQCFYSYWVHIMFGMNVFIMATDLCVCLCACIYVLCNYVPLAYMRLLFSAMCTVFPSQDVFDFANFLCYCFLGCYYFHIEVLTKRWTMLWCALCLWVHGNGFVNIHPVVYLSKLVSLCVPLCAFCVHVCMTVYVPVNVFVSLQKLFSVFMYRAAHY